MSSDDQVTTTENTQDRRPSLWGRIAVRLLFFFAAVLLLALVIVFGGLLTNTIIGEGDIQTYFPEFDEYNQTNVLVNGVVTAARLVTNLRGFDQESELIERMDFFTDCLRDEGAYDVHVYARNAGFSGEIAVLAMVNVDRTRELTQDCASAPLTAQGIDLRPCFGTGSFNIGDEDPERVLLAYVGTDQLLCRRLAQHFRENYDARVLLNPVSPPLNTESE